MGSDLVALVCLETFIPDEPIFFVTFGGQLFPIFIVDIAVYVAIASRFIAVRAGVFIAGTSGNKVGEQQGEGEVFEHWIRELG